MSASLINSVCRIPVRTVSAMFIALLMMGLSGCGGGGGGVAGGGMITGSGVSSSLWNCGDGYVSPLETCDDGNRISGDGCSSMCRTEVSNIAAGIFHACAITGDGGVKCWGDGSYGVLGRASFSSKTPVVVQGIPERVTAISAGAYHTCALTVSGNIYCWGYNYEGQLGSETTEYYSATPIKVAGDSDVFTSISVGAITSCATTTTGSAKCWGANTVTLSGDSYASGDSSTPVAVPEMPERIISIDPGGPHTCAVTEPGKLYCWGGNRTGELGNGTTANSLTPVEVSGILGAVASVSAGSDHTCAVTVDGELYCWGGNESGQLGDGTNNDNSSPVKISAFSSKTRKVMAAYQRTCAISDEGSLKCWGNNQYGSIGDGTTRNRNTPVDVMGISNGVEEVSGFSMTSCALVTGGSIKCWGAMSNELFSNLALGNGYKTAYSTPVDVTGLSSGVEQVDIDTGGGHACAVMTNGGVKCWGEGWLGDGEDGGSYTPVEVEELSGGVKSIDVGGTSQSYSCAVMDAGNVMCWGYEFYAESWEADYNFTPVEATVFGSDVAALSEGNGHACFVTNAGELKCLGDNYSGELGVDPVAMDYSYEPVTVQGLSSGVSAVSAGWANTCALTSAGGVKCWGSNFCGQLGDGTTEDSFTPRDVAGLTSGVKEISAKYTMKCALTDSGAVKWWGCYGEDYDEPYYSTPVDEPALSSGIVDIACGDRHGCALTSSGGIKCWGYGRLGDGTTDYSETPVDVYGLTSGVKAISSGGGAMCAIMNSGGVKCWGGNTDGELGVNPGWAPIDITGF